jgi:hypothetical protein
MTLCKVEYPTRDGWWMGHKGIDLKDPAGYARKTGARVTPIDPCELCEKDHLTGACLL